MRPTRLIINLEQLVDNLKILKNLLPNGCQFYATVKANAYGHGLIEASNAFLKAGADLLAVARTEEGLELRRAGIKAPILVFGGILKDQISECIRHDLILTAPSISKIQSINEIATSQNKKAAVHLKIDTGLERIGVHYYSAETFFEAALSLKMINILGIYSHFACADEEDLSYTKLQLERFLESSQNFQKKVDYKIIRHIANSAALLRLPETYLDAVRPGIALYGVATSPQVKLPKNIKAALELVSQVTYFKVVKSGSAVSYGQSWRSDKDTRIVTIPVGYGDGYPRKLSNRASAIIHGKRYPLRGNLCMDQLMIDIFNDSAYCGDSVKLIGRDEDNNLSITVEEIAQLAETIPHEILTSLNERFERVYI
jgi:alanine racemase